MVVKNEGFSNGSSLISRAENRFSQDYIPTTFETITTTQFDKYNDLGRYPPLVLGHSRKNMTRLRPLTHPGTDLFVITTNVDSPISFENLHKKWIPEVNKDYSHVRGLIVGTKQELREDEEN